jgi:hypothetical protein
LQHQWRARGGINRRMRADEKKLQPFVGEMVVPCRDSLRFLGDLLEKHLGILSNLIATGGVNQAVASNVQQPSFRFLGHAIPGPSLQCRDECVAERVLRAGNITRAGREKSDQAAIRIARGGFNGGARRGFAHQEGLLPPTAKCDPNKGRTSMEE